MGRRQSLSGREPRFVATGLAEVSACHSTSGGGACRLFYANRAVASGGAIVNAGPHNTLILRSIFESNESPQGGGITNLGSDLYVDGARFRNNSAYFMGGAIYNHGRLRINCAEFSTISPNRALSGRDIANDGNLQECSSPDPVDVTASTPTTATCTRCTVRMSGEDEDVGSGHQDQPDGAGGGEGNSGEASGGGGGGVEPQGEVEDEEAPPERGEGPSTRGRGRRLRAAV
jgi:predicted outer membrane repeat protein